MTTSEPPYGMIQWLRTCAPGFTGGRHPRARVLGQRLDQDALLGAGQVGRRRVSSRIRGRRARTARCCRAGSSLAVRWCHPAAVGGRSRAGLRRCGGRRWRRLDRGNFVAASALLPERARRRPAPTRQTAAMPQRRSARRRPLACFSSIAPAYFAHRVIVLRLGATAQLRFPTGAGRRGCSRARGRRCCPIASPACRPSSRDRDAVVCARSPQAAVPRPSRSDRKPPSATAHHDFLPSAGWPAGLPWVGLP